MQTFTQLPQLYRAPAGTMNPQLRWAGIGFRLSPAPPPGLTAPTSFYWPRSIQMIDSDSGGTGMVTVPDSGWITGDFRALQFNAQDGGVGPGQTDYWNLWIAETILDLSAGPGMGFTAGLVWDPTNQNYTSPLETPSVVISGTPTVDNIYTGFVSAKPVALAAVSSATPPFTTSTYAPLTSPYDKFFVYITYTTSASSNSLTVADNATGMIFAFPSTGAVGATSAVLSYNMGASTGGIVIANPGMFVGGSTFSVSGTSITSSSVNFKAYKGY